MSELKKRGIVERTEFVSFRLDVGLKDRVDAFSKKTGYTKGSIYSVALEQFLDREEANIK